MTDKKTAYEIQEEYNKAWARLSEAMQEIRKELQQFSKGYSEE